MPRGCPASRTERSSSGSRPVEVLCPHCLQHRAQVWSDGRGSWTCRCPDCGQVPVEAIDGAALALDEDWLRQKMRLALGSESRDDIDDLGDGAWRTGDAHCSPVLLARDLTRVLHEPKLLDRVRVAGSSIRVIASRPRMTRGSPYSRSSRRARASRSTRLDWRPTEHSLSCSSAGLYSMPCAAAVLA